MDCRRKEESTMTPVFLILANAKIEFWSNERKKAVDREQILGSQTLFIF